MFSFIRKMQEKRIAKEKAKFDALPIPPCGTENKMHHYFWENLTPELGCPICRAKLAQKHKREKTDKLAKAIVDELVFRGFFNK